MEETKFPRFPHVVIIDGRTGRGSPRVIGEEEENERLCSLFFGNGAFRRIERTD